MMAGSAARLGADYMKEKEGNPWVASHLPKLELDLSSQIFFSLSSKAAYVIDSFPSSGDRNMNIAFLRSELVTQGTDICARGPSPSDQAG